MFWTIKIIKVFAERLEDPEVEIAISNILEETDHVSDPIKFETPDHTGEANPISEGIVTLI